MSIFDTIRNAIFRRGAQARGATAAQTGGQGAGTVNRAGTAATGTTATPSAQRPAAAPAGGGATRAAPPAPGGAQQGATATPPPVLHVDIEDVLDGLLREKGQKLNWRSSIVDLMKLLDLDSSLENRRQLARELGFTGNESDSATMNVWLHRQVMRKLEENGGRVPADLKD